MSLYSTEITRYYSWFLEYKLTLVNSVLHGRPLWILYLLHISDKVNTLRPRQNGRHFRDDIFKRIFLNENVWIPVKISLNYIPTGPINNIPTLVQIMAWRRSADKPLSEPMMVILPTHICVTRPQWVNRTQDQIWTHKRHPISRPHGWALGYLLWQFWEKFTVLWQCTVPKSTTHLLSASVLPDWYVPTEHWLTQLISEKEKNFLLIYWSLGRNV